MRRYLTDLAVRRGVATSTQKQAFIALLFLFRHVLHRGIRDLEGTARARKPRRLPVVLSREEIGSVFAQLSGTHLLMCRLIYGGGLRLSECLQLRIQDLDLPGNSLTVRSGKWDKDRITLLPSGLELGMVLGVSLAAERREDITCIPPPSSAPSTAQFSEAVLPGARVFTPSATVSRHTCWRTDTTSGPYRSYSVTQT